MNQPRTPVAMDPASPVLVELGALLGNRLSTSLALRERLFDKPFYRLVHAEADGLPGLKLVAGAETQLAPTEARWVAVTLRVPHEVLTQAGAGAHEIHFNVERVPAGGESAVRR